MEMEDEVPLAVHILLDCSGSMINNKDRAVEAMNAFLEQLAMSITPAMVTMSRFNTFLAEPPMIEDAAIYDLPRLTPEKYLIAGGTNIFRSTMKGIAVTQRAKARTKIMVVLTDGLSDPTLKAECRREIVAMQKQGWLFLFLGMTMQVKEGHYTQTDVNRLTEQMKATAASMAILPEHRVTVPFEGLSEAMREAAMMCLEFQGTGETKFGKENR